MPDSIVLCAGLKVICDELWSIISNEMFWKVMCCKPLPRGIQKPLFSPQAILSRHPLPLSLEMGRQHLGAPFAMAMMATPRGEVGGTLFTA